MGQATPLHQPHRNRFAALETATAMCEASIPSSVTQVVSRQDEVTQWNDERHVHFSN